MGKLRLMGTSEKLGVTRYKTFIESSLLHHSSVIYNHRHANDKADIDKITKAASKLSNATLPNLRDTITKRISTKALRMVTANRHPVLSFSQLPSGRYCNLRSRINSRANCFSSVAIQNLTSILFSQFVWRPLIMCYFSIYELTFFSSTCRIQSYLSWYWYIKGILHYMSNTGASQKYWRLDRYVTVIIDLDDLWCRKTVYCHVGYNNCCLIRSLYLTSSHQPAIQLGLLLCYAVANNGLVKQLLTTRGAVYHILLILPFVIILLFYVLTASVISLGSIQCCGSMTDWD